ncbi:hypothetical protein JCM12294_34740 [Desulfocicer niacini]
MYHFPGAVSIESSTPDLINGKSIRSDPLRSVIKFMSGSDSNSYVLHGDDKFDACF